MPTHSTALQGTALQGTALQGTALQGMLSDVKNLTGYIYLHKQDFPQSVMDSVHRLYAVTH